MWNKVFPGRTQEGLLLASVFIHLVLVIEHLFIYCQRAENEKIISQSVGIIKCCDQNCARVSKNDKNCHIHSMKL